MTGFENGSQVEGYPGSTLSVTLTAVSPRSTPGPQSGFSKTLCSLTGSHRARAQFYG